MPKQGKTDFYWQNKISGERHYVKGTDWLVERAKNVRLLDVYPLNTRTSSVKLLAYLEDGVFYHARFDNIEEAKKFATRVVFNGSNKEIHST